MGRYTAGGTGRDLIAGAIAGAVAVWAMGKLDFHLYRLGGPERIRRTEAARPGGKDPAHVLAGRAADAMGVDFGDPKDNPAGHAVRYSMGIGLGAMYGLLRSVSPFFTRGRGAVFGVVTFVVKDEWLNTAMGTAGNPFAYPWQDHARGAATHALFGVVTDLVTRVLAPWRDRVVIEQGPSVAERIDQGRQGAVRLAYQAKPVLEDAYRGALRQAYQAKPVLDDAYRGAVRQAQQVRRTSRF